MDKLDTLAIRLQGVATLGRRIAMRAAVPVQRPNASPTARQLQCSSGRSAEAEEAAAEEEGDD